MSVSTAASRPPVAASGMFQRLSGGMMRLRPAPAKNTTMAIVNVRSPGASIAVIVWSRLPWLRAARPPHPASHGPPPPPPPPPGGGGGGRKRGGGGGVAPPPGGGGGGGPGGGGGGGEMERFESKAIF